MSTATELLAGYGVSFSEGRAFIYANLSNPQIIYDTAYDYGVTFSMLAELYGQSVTETQVIDFFDVLGFDTSDSRLLGTGADALNLAAQSNIVSGVFALANSNTPFVNSLISGDSWGGGYVTYGFPSSRPAAYAFDSDLRSGWRALNYQEQNAFNNVVAAQNKYLNTDLLLSYGSIEINVSAIQQFSAEAFAYFPGDDLGGDIFLNRDSGGEDYYSYGGYGIFTMVHELGHAMGLDHSFEGVILNSAYDSSYYTAMSYTSKGNYKVQALDEGSSYSTYTEDANRTDLGVIDIAALQAIYGADMSTNAGDTVYVYNEDERAFETASGHYFTIWDAGGEDTLDLTDAEYDSTINLNDYTLSSVSERTSYEEAVDVANAAGLTSQSAISFIQDFIEELGDEAFLNQNNIGIAYGVVIENVITGAGDDTVTDNEVDNEIYTGSGNDIIYLGAGGYDYIDGGSGLDKIVLTVGSSSVDSYVDSEGYHLLAESFSATLVGVETIQYSDTSISIA